MCLEEVVEQRPPRHAVNDEVMCRKQQGFRAVGPSTVQRAEERPAGQVEGRHERGGRLVTWPESGVRRSRRGHIRRAPEEVWRIGDRHAPFVTVAGEARAQRLVPHDHGGECGAYGLGVERHITFEEDALCVVMRVHGDGGQKLVLRRPELWRVQRVGRASRHAAYRVGELRDRLGGEEQPRGEGHPSARGARDDLHGQQGVATEGKEVVIDTDGGVPQHFLPDGNKLLLVR